MKIREGEYAERGDYHKKLDKNWPYYPIYLLKIEFVDKFLFNFPKNKKKRDFSYLPNIFHINP